MRTHARIFTISCNQIVHKLVQVQIPSQRSKTCSEGAHTLREVQNIDTTMPMKMVNIFFYNLLLLAGVANFIAIEL